MGEADMAHMLRLLDGRERIEPVGTTDSLTTPSVDSEVADTKRCEVLKEVRALRGVDVISLYTQLHYDAGCGD